MNSIEHLSNLSNISIEDENFSVVPEYSFSFSSDDLTCSEIETDTEQYDNSQVQVIPQLPVDGFSESKTPVQRDFHIEGKAKRFNPCPSLFSPGLVLRSPQLRSPQLNFKSPRFTHSKSLDHIATFLKSPRLKASEVNKSNTSDDNASDCSLDETNDQETAHRNSKSSPKIRWAKDVTLRTNKMAAKRSTRHYLASPYLNLEDSSDSEHEVCRMTDTRSPKVYTRRKASPNAVGLHKDIARGRQHSSLINVEHSAQTLVLSDGPPNDVSGLGFVDSSGNASSMGVFDKNTESAPHQAAIRPAIPNIADEDMSPAYMLPSPITKLQESLHHLERIDSGSSRTPVAFQDNRREYRSLMAASNNGNKEIEVSLPMTFAARRRSASVAISAVKIPRTLEHRYPDLKDRIPPLSPRYTDSFSNMSPFVIRGQSIFENFKGSPRHYSPALKNSGSPNLNLKRHAASPRMEKYDEL